MSTNNTSSTETSVRKVTLGNVFQRKGLEVLTYIDKTKLVENEVVFCVLKAEKVPVANSKFDIKEQWILTIAVPTSDSTVRRYWLTFVPNEVRDDFMTAIEEALTEAHKQGLEAVHSCVLQAIPLANYNNPFYAINFTQQECECGLDG